MKRKLKDSVKNVLAVVILYSICIIGVLLINARLNYLEQQKSADVSEVQTAQIHSVN